MEKYATTLTIFGAQRLSEKLDRLKKRYERISQDLKDKTVSHSISSLRRLEQEFLMFDMKKIEGILSRSKIMKKNDHPSTVELGTRVRYIQAEKTTVEITLVDPLEADPLAGRISIQSPVAQALLGHRQNETVLVVTPKGISKLDIIQLL